MFWLQLYTIEISTSKKNITLIRSFDFLCQDQSRARVFVFAGFGKDERNNDGNIQQTNVTLLSNEECYEKLNNIMKTKVQGYNNRIKIQQAVYDGITDQLICTNGLAVEKCKKGRCRKFFSVSFNSTIITNLMVS